MAPQSGATAHPTTADSPYGGVAIGLHWTCVLTIVTLWLIGQFVGFLPRGSLRLGIWSIHVLLGFALVLVVAMRIFWRIHRPPGETQDRGLQNVAAQAVHLMLYGLMVIVIGLGVANAFLRGYSMFGLWTLPKLPGGAALARSVNGWHGLAANALVGLAALHAAAAVFHQLVLRDGVLGRMIPALQSRGTAVDVK